MSLIGANSCEFELTDVTAIFHLTQSLLGTAASMPLWFSGALKLVVLALIATTYPAFRSATSCLRFKKKQQQKVVLAV